MSIIDLGNEVKLFKGSKYPIGANMGVSKGVIDRIGMFNESLGRTGTSMLGGEEKDFFFRIKEAGIPIYYYPKMLVHHVIPAKRLTVEFIKKQAEGIGVSENDLTEIFKDFVVINTYDTSKQKCIGLGLPIAEKIIKQHSGKISAKSILNMGTSVTISLPLNN